MKTKGTDVSHGSWGGAWIAWRDFNELVWEIGCYQWCQGCLFSCEAEPFASYALFGFGFEMQVWEMESWGGVD